MKHDFDLDRRKFLVTVGRAELTVAGTLGRGLGQPAGHQKGTNAR